MKTYPYIQINSISDLPEPEENTGLVGHYAFQYIDFTEAAAYALNNTFVDCFFFGCELLPQQHRLLKQCIVLPRMGQSFHAFFPDLYDADTLYEGFDPEDAQSMLRTFDARVCSEYLAAGQVCDDIRITLARSLHDHSINDALDDFLRRFPKKDVVGIMGGHGIRRADSGYKKIVLLSKKLTEKGKVMLSGGGPGAMEATHLGSWMAGRTARDVEDAMNILISAGEDNPFLWLRSAFEVRTRFPQDKYVSLSIPTWFYGHEPSTPLATHIAKFFMNSVREDMILSVAQGGIIFTPGSAGTMQEIFQDANKLHYQTETNHAPMVFMGVEFYTETQPVYTFLKDLCEKGRYNNLNLSITDDPEVVISKIINV